MRSVLLTDGGGTPVTEEKAEVQWLEYKLAMPLLHAYADKAGGFQFDESIFNELFDHLWRDIESPRITVTELSPLMGVEIESDQIQVDHNVRLRQLSNDEIEEWLNPVHSTMPFLSQQPLTVDELLRLQCAIEIVHQRERHPPSGSTGGDGEMTSRLVTAMHLLTDASARVAFTTRRTSDCLTRGLGTSYAPSILLPGPPAKIEKSQESDLVELYRRLKSSPNLAKIKLGLSRWNLAGARLAHEDRLIDYWIALESLFTPDTTQELSYRTALRIAAFVGSNGSERSKIYEQMKESYRLRSEIVHGSIGRRKRRLPSGELVALTRSYLRQALLKTLESGVDFEPSTLEVHLLEKE